MGKPQRRTDLRLVSHQRDSAISISEGRPPVVTPGVYDLVLVKWELLAMFGKRAQKLVLHFRIVSFGRYFELVIPRFYNVRKTRNGRFTAPWSSDLVREYGRLFGAPSRPDRLSMEKFANVVVTGRVRQVTRDQRKRRLPPCFQYSVVGELISVKAGGGAR